MNKRIFLKTFLLFLTFFAVTQHINLVCAAQTSGLTNGSIYNLTNKASGKSLNVNYGSDTNGTNVNQYTKDGSTEQFFKLVYNSSRDSYKLYAMCSSNGGNRVVDVYRPIQAGANVDIWTPDDNDAQDLIITNRGNGYYSIHLRYNTNLALTSYGTGNGGGSGTTSTSTGNVFVTTYTGADNQLWSIKTGAVCNYYVDSADRTGTHTHTQTNTQNMGYSYFSRRNNTSSTNFLNDLKNNEIFVFHGHGNSGILASSTTTALVSSSNISALQSNSLSKVKLALILSCKGGTAPSGGTSIVDAINGRGAKCTVGWSDTIHMECAVRWNQLFWEKLYNENETIVEGFRHADYWILAEYGDSIYQEFSANRVERGDIYQNL